MAVDRGGGVGFRAFDDWDLDMGMTAAGAVVLLLLVLGVRASRENSLGVLG